MPIGDAVANGKSGERCDKKGHFSPLGGEYEPPFLLEKKRTSLQKANEFIRQLYRLLCKNPLHKESSLRR
jgi:hypothetical protein